METTTNVKLNKPAKGDFDWGATLNGNFDMLDSLIGDLNANVATVPEVYVYNGTFNGSTGTEITLPRSVDNINEYACKVSATSRAGAIDDIYITKAADKVTIHCSAANTTDTFSVSIYYVSDAFNDGVSVHRKWFVSPSSEAETDHGNSSIDGTLADVITNHVSGEQSTIELPGRHSYQLRQSLIVPDNAEIIFQKGAIIDTDISLRDGSYQWDPSGSGSGEYYLQASGGGNPSINPPDDLFEDGTKMTPGIVGSLIAGECAWSDNDGLGYATSYVRLSGEIDPDTKAVDYIQAGYDLTINGPFDAGSYQVFNGTGAVTFATGAVKGAYPQWWGAVGDGVNDDSVAMQAAFDCAYASNLPIHLSSGTYYTGRINWRGNSIIGLGDNRVDVVLKGKAGQDILYAYGGTGSSSIQHTRLENFKLLVDSSSDVSGGLSRHGVGNAAIAFEHDDGAVNNNYWRLLNAMVGNIIIISTDGIINNSCGLYLQGHPYKVVFERLVIQNLAYGYYEDYPTTNVTSSEVAPDFNSYLNCLFTNCNKAFRGVNGQKCYIYNMEINGGLYGFYLDSIASLARSSPNSCTMINLRTEMTAPTQPFYITGIRHTFINLHRLDAAAVDTEIDCDQSTFITSTFQSTGVLNINGNYNNFIRCASRYYTDVNDLGVGNYVDMQYPISVARPTSPMVLTKNKPVSNSRDNVSGYLGIVDKLFISALDTLIAPDDACLVGAAVGHKTVTTDNTLELGRKWNQANNGGCYFYSLNGYGGETMKVGTYLPQGRVRVYIKAKTPDGNTTQLCKICTGAGGDNRGEGTLSWTTAWTTKSFDADLSGAAIDDKIQPTFNDLAAGAQIDIAWILIRPFAEDILSEHYIGFERSADPSEPDEGTFVIWMSDGTGKGDDGDILCASQAGGTTKYTTLFDHSTGGAW